jgi:hypothetical protein
MEITVVADMVTAAQRARQRADRLAYAAETIGDVQPCRDIGAERNRLRHAAANADQLASVLEALAGPRSR